MTYSLAELYNFMVAETEYREIMLSALIKRDGPRISPTYENELRANLKKLQQVTALIDRAEKAGIIC